MKSRDEYKYAGALKRKFVPGNQLMDEKGIIYIPIDCVFCDTTFRAYRRSFAGTGKKCPECGAHYASDGMATPLLVWVQQQTQTEVA